MVTKEQARNIYNLYSQIETTNKAIGVLKKVIEKNDKTDSRADIIDGKWGVHQSIELHIPNFILNPELEDRYNGATIYHVSPRDAVLVLENHVVRLSKELEAEQEKVKE